MKTIIITIAILLMATSTATGNIYRDMDLQADGKVNLHNITFNNYIYTGLEVKGDGIVQLQTQLNLYRTDIDQDYSIQLQSADDTLRPVEAVTAITSADGKGQHDYAVKVAPDAGKQALLDIDYLFSSLDPANDEYDMGDMVHVFSELEIDTTAQVSMGEFRSYANVQATDGEGFMEEIRVRDGQTVFDDYISVDELREVEIEIED